MTALTASDANLPNLAKTEQPHSLPLAVLHGQPLLQMPRDLYIPPDALEVVLEAFEGPLDLLLYLIRKQNLDITDIPVAEITRQYVAYINLMQVLKLELAADYLVMAAMLAEIKSRLLLPAPPLDELIDGDDTFNDDPRAELVRRLQEYERFRMAAQNLDTLPRLERDTDPAHAHPGEVVAMAEPPTVSLADMLGALRQVLARAQVNGEHTVVRETLSVRQRMSQVLQAVDDGQWHAFESLFVAEEGRQGVLVTLLAILELSKEQLLDIEQEQALGPIRVGARGRVH